jgi:hypothetical protein
MAWGVRWYIVGSVVLGVLGVLVGCSGSGIFVERESWRHEAEMACLAGGAVKEGVNIVRIKPINGPGMCGADFPLKVAALGEGSPLGYSDEVRPPSAIPGSEQPRWPGDTPPPDKPRVESFPSRFGSSAPRVVPVQSGGVDAPISLSPPGNPDGANPPVPPYDFRRPYGAPPAPLTPPAPRAGNARELPPGSYDLSPVPIERRRVIDAQVPRGYEPPPAVRANARAAPLPPDVAVGAVNRARMIDEDERERQPVPALGPSRGVAADSIPAVSVSPAATLACPMVSELERWIANAVQPAAMRWFGAPVVEIKQISAYSCRGMNGNPNARISEHAFGNALDVAAFTLADGRKITVKNGWHGLPEEQGFLRDVQGAACEQFTTVLAPGSNVYHYDHIHVDLMRRAGGRHACNPHAVPGEVVAAKAAGGRYAGRRDPATTGSVNVPPAKRSSSFKPEERRERALPLAEPGNDGEDD